MLQLGAKRPPSLPRIGLPLPAVGVSAGALISVGALGAADGGYFPVSWGWSSLGFGWAALLIVVCSKRIRVTPFDAAFAASLLALACWYFASALWSPSATGPVFEGERALVYALGGTAALLAARHDNFHWLIAGVLGGTVLCDLYGLGTRLLPDRLGTLYPSTGGRLAVPLGYWNGLGIFSTVGLLLAAGCASRCRTHFGRAAAAAGMPILSATLYFTFSRGAWIALAAGALALVAVGSGRLQLVTRSMVLALPSALIVALAAHSRPLTTKGSDLVATAPAGHRFARDLAVAIVASALLSLVVGAIASRVGVGRGTRVAYGALLVVISLGAAAGGIAREGGPIAAARSGWHAFASPPAAVESGPRLDQRLFSLSGNRRIDLWRSAWNEARAHPWLGGGGGSYEQWWNAHRESTLDVRDAHNFYLETLAELGPIGLILLALALASPLAAAVAARHHPMTAPALGAYVAYLVHAGADWDWEIPAVTLTGVFCGAGIIAAARRESRFLSPRLRATAAVALLALLAVSFVVLLGNTALSAASEAAAYGQWKKSARDARTAVRWMPWSSEPWRVLGEAELALRKSAARPDLERAASKDGNDWRIWFDLAAATTGRQAQQALARARALNPLSPELRTGP